MSAAPIPTVLQQEWRSVANIFFKIVMACRRSREEEPAPAARRARSDCYWYSLYRSRRLSAIMAMNSELVGFPRLFWMV